DQQDDQANEKQSAAAERKRQDQRRVAAFLLAWAAPHWAVAKVLFLGPRRPLARRGRFATMDRRRARGCLDGCRRVILAGGEGSGTLRALHLPAGRQGLVEA